jgi:hypothetical protein
MNVRRAQEIALLTGCAYEMAAMTVLRGRVPTISTIVYEGSQNPRLRFLVWAWLGYIAHHFLIDSAPKAALPYPQIPERH